MGVEDGSLDPQEVVKHYLWKAKKDRLNAWTRLHEDYVEKKFDIFVDRFLHGAPLAIKDNILTKDYETTCASNILKGYIPPYSATCFEKLEQAWGLMLGKTNMDEFAMGSSTEHSAFWPTKHPLDHDRVPWGSSWWSAVAVADDQCIAALGTETWGSVRQPAALCGIVGIKPTYGRVSRRWVQAMAASVNQVGVFAKNVEDGALLLDIISWYDERDAKSIDDQKDKERRNKELDKRDVASLKLAVPKQFFGPWLDSRIASACREKIEYLHSQGAVVEEIDLPLLEYAIPIYYILIPAEVSSEMARFDGIRFGLQEDTLDHDSIYKYYEHIRQKWFGDEVKRRIMVGSYVLSAGFYDAYYHKAQQVQQKLRNEFTRVYQDFDAIIGPTTPSLARKIGEKVDDPIQMYLEDMYTVPANIMWLPAISVPIGSAKEDGKDLPIGFQIMTKRQDELTMFQIGEMVMKSDE